MPAKPSGADLLVALILVRDQVPAFTREAQGMSLLGFLPPAPILLAAVATLPNL